MNGTNHYSFLCHLGPTCLAAIQVQNLGWSEVTVFAARPVTTHSDCPTATARGRSHGGRVTATYDLEVKFFSESLQPVTSTLGPQAQTPACKSDHEHLRVGDHQRPASDRRGWRTCGWRAKAEPHQEKGSGTAPTVRWRRSVAGRTPNGRRGDPRFRPKCLRWGQKSTPCVTSAKTGSFWPVPRTAEE